MPDEIGSMCHVVDVQSRTISRDDYGGAEQTWTTIATRFAKIEPLSGRELWRAQGVTPEATHRVVMRYMEAVTAKCRLVHRGRVFQIESVLDVDETKSTMVLICKELI